MNSASFTELFRVEGQPQNSGAHQPFRIDEPDQVWFIESGYVNIFTVSVGTDGPGSRKHLLRAESGGLMLGMHPAPAGVDLCFQAVASKGSRLSRLPQNRLRQMAQRPALRPLVASALEQWIDSLHRSLCDGPLPPECIAAGAEPELA